MLQALHENKTTAYCLFVTKSSIWCNIKKFAWYATNETFLLASDLTSVMRSHVCNLYIFYGFGLYFEISKGSGY